MSEADEIEVKETPTFRKAFKKLAEKDKVRVENEIDRIIEDPEIGEQKKGDLSYLRVHKFELNRQLALLGYSWHEGKCTIYLLNVGTHENFYRDARRRRDADLKIIR